MEEWIEANIFVHEGKQKDVLLNVIKPLVLRLRSEFGIIAYHFLHEPNNEIRFRVLTTPDKVEKIKELLDNLVTREQIRELKYPETPYEGERQNFGEDGWKTTYKFLEVGSDFALDLMDDNTRKGNYFNPLYFSHLLLNQNSLNQFEEAVFHFRCSMERMFTMVETLYIAPLRDKVTQLENRIQALEKERTAT